MNTATVISLNGSTLRAVPAMHYRAVFANEVNQLCSRETTRPDAIAVELAPHMVQEIVQWMKELRIGPFKEVLLPCMLGVLVRNRLIHPDYRYSAIFLQEHFRKPLSEISSELKKQFLHFSDQYLVGLSSTDSIIEAIRCAVELDIPVYGVDLDEFAPGTNEQLLVGDPSNPIFDLPVYVSQNERAATQMRNSYVDSRRELVMAARLKNIMNKHLQVLFTGGLAHWEKIKELMADESIRPAEFLIQDRKPEFTRVIIHPRMAVMFMDTYPILTTRYEETRRNPLISEGQTRSLSDHAQIFQDILQQTYLQYYAKSESNVSIHAANKELQRISDFERLLASMRLVHQQSTNSMSGLLEAAFSMMSLDFCNILTYHLMDIGRSWASPNDFSELPVISNTPQSEQKSSLHEDQFHLIETRLNDQEKVSGNKKRSEPFYVEFQTRQRLDHQLLKLWDWKDEPREPSRKGSWNAWVWPPCEALLFGAAYEAAKIAVCESNENESAVFEGSVYNGLDIKASIRSVVSGERKIYIRKPSTSKKTFVPNGKKPEPTVFIFEESVEVSSYWTLLMGGTNMGKHIRNKSRYEKIVNQSGSYFISSISKTSPIETPAHLKPYVDSTTLINAVTVFGSPCMNAHQGAEWCEDNDFQCCPVLPYSGYDYLIEHYQNRFQMDMSKDDWKTALIRFAIPYAKERVVVVAPVGYRIPASINTEAKRRRISLSILPLNYFPAERVAEMRKRVIVNALDSDGFNFSPEVEAALGQKANQYFELLPLYMQQQLKKTK